jgi:hypothetical protein
MFGIESYKNKDELLEEQYKAKYLKYKQKYLELNQTGGLPRSGTYAYLTTEETANQLVALYNKCKKRDGSDVQFNIDIAGQLTGIADTVALSGTGQLTGIADTVALTGTINVTNNIDNNPQFGTLIQAKITNFNKMISDENNRFVNLINSEKAKLAKLFSDENNRFVGLINSEKAKLAKLITTEKNNYTNSFNEHLIKCNTPELSAIENLLNDNAYAIKINTKKIELIHNTSIMQKMSKDKGTQIKKNSSTISELKINFNPDTPNIFQSILSRLKEDNIKYTNYTVPTHYVLIDHTITSSKLVGDGLPKPIPQ